jgi:hypothetical protein
MVLAATGILSPQKTMVPADLRWEWRVAALILLLARSHGRSASLSQVQAYGRGMLAPEAQPALQSGRRDPFSSVPQFRDDPAWLRATELAVGLGYARWQRSGRIEITDHGQDAVREIAESGALAPEQAFLATVRPTAAAVERIRGRER